MKALDRRYLTRTAAALIVGFAVTTVGVPTATSAGTANQVAANSPAICLSVSQVAANPCAKNPCAKKTGAKKTGTKNPCAKNPCAKNPCAKK